MLDKKLDRQVSIAIWQFILRIGFIAGYICIFASLASLGTWNDDDTIPVAGIIGIIMVAICWIAHVVMWIIGIVNATSIHKLTGDSTILIVFSVLTFLFGHWIVAAAQRKKFKGTTYQLNTKEVPSSFEAKLKQSFMDGVITAEEYKQKLDDHKKK